MQPQVGFTDDSINVWGVNVPYLKAVQDTTEQSPYQNWTLNISAGDLSKKISANYKDIGIIKEINVSGLKNITLIVQVNHKQ